MESGLAGGMRVPRGVATILGNLMPMAVAKRTPSGQDFCNKGRKTNLICASVFLQSGCCYQKLKKKTSWQIKRERETETETERHKQKKKQRETKGEREREQEKIECLLINNS